MPTSIQKSSQDTLKALYDAIGFSTEEADYLFSKGYCSAITILSGYYNGKLQNLEKQVSKWLHRITYQACAVHIMETRYRRQL